MKLQTALVCPKCEEVVENSTQRCPSCGSRTLCLLLRWLEHKFGDKYVPTQVRN